MDKGKIASETDEVILNAKNCPTNMLAHHSYDLEL